MFQSVANPEPCANASSPMETITTTAPSVNVDMTSVATWLKIIAGLAAVYALYEFFKKR